MTMLLAQLTYRCVSVTEDPGRDFKPVVKLLRCDADGWVMLAGADFKGELGETNMPLQVDFSPGKVYRLTVEEVE